jgi:hypothetical protein
MRYLLVAGGSSQPPLVFERKECPFFALQGVLQPVPSWEMRIILASWITVPLRIIYNSHLRKQSRQDDCIPRLAELSLGEGMSHTSKDGRRWMERREKFDDQSLLFEWCAGRVDPLNSPYLGMVSRDDKHNNVPASGTTAFYIYVVVNYTLM